MKLWKWEPENLPSVTHSIRTAIAATLSLAVARLFGLPEAYWAAIATLVVMQSTLGATLLLSIERIAATALGALAGALVASYFTVNLLLFAAAVFVLGLFVLCFSHGENRVSVCERHAGHYRAYSAFTHCVDCRASSLLRSLGWNSSRFGARCRLARGSTRIRKTKR